MTEIKNFYNIMDKHYLNSPSNPNFKVHGIKIPSRIVVNGPSGSGKSQFVINLLDKFCKGKGTFHNIWLITKNADEPLYNYLRDVSKGAVIIKEGIENLPPLDKMDKQVNNLVIIDDLVLEKNQQSIVDYYIRARKLSTTIAYLSQSYYAIPKIIRQNCNYFIILKMSNVRNVNLILSEFNLGINKQELLNIYKYCTKDKFNFLLIDVDAPEEQRFRHNFTKVINIEDFK